MKHIAERVRTVGTHFSRGCSVKDRWRYVLKTSSKIYQSICAGGAPMFARGSTMILESEYLPIQTGSRWVKHELVGAELQSELFELLKSAEKARFALDCLLAFENPQTLLPPTYIAAGLSWLDSKLATETETMVDKGEAKNGSAC